MRIVKKLDILSYRLLCYTDLETIDGFQRYKIAYTDTFSKPPWFESVSEEYAACRENVGLSDYSSFTKIDLWVRCFTTDTVKIHQVL